jgi:hypothetical protein
MQYTVLLLRMQLSSGMLLACSISMVGISAASLAAGHERHAHALLPDSPQRTYMPFPAVSDLSADVVSKDIDSLGRISKGLGRRNRTSDGPSGNLGANAYLYFL